MDAPAPAPPAAIPDPPEPFHLHVTIDASTREKLRRAQELLSHAIPSGDVAQVLDRALDALIRQPEKRKFAATTRPRSRPRPNPRRLATASERAVPAHVRRAVWERDGGQCTFVGDTGHRCGSRHLLEFGVDFMKGKRAEARQRSASTRRQPAGAMTPSNSS